MISFKTWGIFSLLFTCYFLILQVIGDMLSIALDQDFKWWFNSNLDVLLTGFVAFYIQALAVFLFLLRFYSRKKIWYTILGITILIPILIGTRFFIQEKLGLWIFNQTNYNPSVSLKYYFVDNIYYTVTYGSFGLVFFFVNKINTQQKLLQEKMRAELQLLKSQINPHFLFNSINSIYSLVFQKSDQSLVAIEKLSSILRYMLYEQREKVELQEEVQFLNDYIELQKLRFGNIHADIQIIYSGNQTIPPALLIAFVENAFKHGDTQDPMHPIVIDLKMEKETELNFLVKNKRLSIKSDNQEGVGLDNVRRRLELIYPRKHSLIILEEEHTFMVQLKMQL